MNRRRGLCVIAALWLIAGCGAAPAQPTDRPTVSAPPAAAAATPSAAPSAAPPASAEPASTAAPPVSPDAPAPPSWLALASSDDSVEGIGSIDLIDIHTGRVQAAICPVTDLGLVGWSPDGRWLVCPFNYGTPALTLIDGAALSQTIALNTESISDPSTPALAWSADSRQVAVSTHAGVLAFDPAAPASPREVARCESYRCTGLAWSPDGRWLAYGQENGLKIIGIDGAAGPVTELGIAPRDQALYESGETTVVEPIAWSAAGDQLAYATKAGVFVLPIASGEARMVADAAVAAAGIDGLRWSPDGTALELTRADGATLRLAAAGPAAPVDISGAGDSRHRAVTADGQCVAELRQTGTAAVPAVGTDTREAAVYDLVVRYAARDSYVVLKQGIVALDEKIAIAPVTNSPTLIQTDPAMQGCAVLELQTRLEALGYPVGAIDGIYGPVTAAAVGRFQAAQGLAETNQADAATWRALRLPK